MERVVVTGASSGIGAACVQQFRDRGAEVIGVDVVETSTADEHVSLDVGDADCGIRLTEVLAGRPIDGLVNNAGVQLNKAGEDTTAQDFDRVTAVNVRGPLLISGALHQSLAESRGFIVNIASVHAIATSRMISAYAASKGALLSMTRALAIEWGPDVRVNAVLPGATSTEMLTAGLSRTGSSVESLGRRHPIGRVGTAAEIADAVMFLATNTFVTGAALVVDGGATAQLSTE